MRLKRTGIVWKMRSLVICTAYNNFCIFQLKLKRCVKNVAQSQWQKFACRLWCGTWSKSVDLKEITAEIMITRKHKHKQTHKHTYTYMYIYIYINVYTHIYLYTFLVWIFLLFRNFSHRILKNLNYSRFCTIN
jgi:hypothetical protein